MAYATTADVQLRMPQFQLSATSKPSLTDAAAMITDAEQELDAQLRNLGYSVPVVQATSPISWQIVVALSCYSAIWRILEARNAAVGGESTNQSAQRSWKYVTDRIEWLKDPKHPFELVDCPRLDTAVVKPAEILEQIEWPCSREGENWPFSQRTTLTQVF